MSFSKIKLICTGRELVLCYKNLLIVLCALEFTRVPGTSSSGNSDQHSHQLQYSIYSEKCTAMLSLAKPNILMSASPSLMEYHLFLASFASGLIGGCCASLMYLEIFPLDSETSWPLERSFKITKMLKELHIHLKIWSPLKVIFK